jgi:hypothetical protein
MDEPTPWSLTSLREKLIKISAKVVSQPGTSPLQIAEVAVLRQMFRKILSPIARLRQTTTAKVRLDTAKLRVSAPRRSQLIGSTLAAHVGRLRAQNAAIGM